MDLWIRSQDRKRLSPIQEDLYIPNSRTGEDFVICYRDEILGHYKKEEKVLEVLDEIQEHLDYLNIGNINRVDEKGFRVSTIYNMPEE